MIPYKNYHICDCTLAFISCNSFPSIRLRVPSNNSASGVYIATTDVSLTKGAAPASTVSASTIRLSNISRRDEQRVRTLDGRKEWSSIAEKEVYYILRCTPFAISPSHWCHCTIYIALIVNCGCISLFGGWVLLWTRIQPTGEDLQESLLRRMLRINKNELDWILNRKRLASLMLIEIIYKIQRASSANLLVIIKFTIVLRYSWCILDNPSGDCIKPYVVTHSHLLPFVPETPLGANLDSY